MAIKEDIIFEIASESSDEISVGSLFLRIPRIPAFSTSTGNGDR